MKMLGKMFVAGLIGVILAQILLALSSCAYPKDPITVPFDRGLGQIDGITTHAENVPMTVCVDQDDRYFGELVQLVQSGTAWWNGYLERHVGCPVFTVDLRNDTPLFCDIIVKTGPLEPNVSGVNQGWWARRSDPPGAFYKSEVTLREDYFGIPDYYKGVIIHELGHSFGLADDPGRDFAQLGSVMASPLPREYRPTVSDLQHIINSVRCEEEN